jgi:hypothetical protein
MSLSFVNRNVRAFCSDTVEFTNGRSLKQLTNSILSQLYKTTEHKTQDRQYTYKATVKRIRIVIFVVEKLQVLHFLRCVCSLSYPAWKAYALYYIGTCSLSSFTIFSHLISYTAWFSKIEFLNTKCTFWFSLQMFSEIFLIPRRIQRDTAITAHASSCKVAVIFVGF